MVSFNPNNHGELYGRLVKIERKELKEGRILNIYTVRVNNPAECKVKTDDIVFKIFNNKDYEETLKVDDYIRVFTYVKMNKFGNAEIFANQVMHSEECK